MFVLLIILLILLIATIFAGIRIVPESYAYVVERLGKYHDVLGPGLHVIIPFIDNVRRKVLLKEQTLDFAPQPVTTKDNVTMQIDSVVYFIVSDPRLYTYGVQNPVMAMENLTATTMRNIVGYMTLDETLTSRDKINSQMLAIIDEATDPWGIKCRRIEVKTLSFPSQIRDAMEKQMKAEREKRAAILQAEGEKQAMILQAEGTKESAILNAEAQKQATILAAEAQKEKEIREAEGQAEAIRKIHAATAEGLLMLKKAGADESVLKLKSLETMGKVADGKATKIIIPSELQGLAGMMAAAKEVVKE